MSNNQNQIRAIIVKRYGGSFTIEPYSRSSLDIHRTYSPDACVAYVDEDLVVASLELDSAARGLQFRLSDLYHAITETPEVPEVVDGGDPAEQAIQAAGEDLTIDQAEDLAPAGRYR